jgi:hypothetical protein
MLILVDLAGEKLLLTIGAQDDVIGNLHKFANY